MERLHAISTNFYIYLCFASLIANSQDLEDDIA